MKTNDASLLVKTVAVALAVLPGVGMAATIDGINDDFNAMLSMPGEFEVGDGESHVIAHQKEPHLYRICVRKSRHNVPLRVKYDGMQLSISGGNCADFEAMHIEVSPAGKLDKGNVLMGRYSHSS
jgi:hypothetical protein